MVCEQILISKYTPRPVFAVFFKNQLDPERRAQQYYVHIIQLARVLLYRQTLNSFISRDSFFTFWASQIISARISAFPAMVIFALCSFESSLPLW